MLPYFFDKLSSSLVHVNCINQSILSGTGSEKSFTMLQLDDKPCENCGRMLKAVNPQKGAAYFYPCACNRPVQTGMGVTYPGSQEHDLILAGGAWNLNNLMTAQPQKWLQLNVENGPCQHSRRQGDNYGVTCMECGETIAGYGFWGEGSKTCIHEWGRMDDESKEEMCIYCQVYRPAQPKPVLHQWRKGDLGRVNNHLVLFLEEERSIWVSQGGDCGYWPASKVEFIQHTSLQYRFIHWKETVVDYLAGKFTSYFKS